jgi:hypothetical protein
MNMDIDPKNLRTVTFPNVDRKPRNQTTRVGAIRNFIKRTWSNSICLSRSLRIFLLDMALVEGAEKHSGQIVKTLYVGATKPPAFGLGQFYSKSEAFEKYANFQFVMDTIYSDYTIIALTRNVNGLNIIRGLRRYEEQADLIFIDAELLITQRLDRFQYLAIPSWVPQKLILADRWEDVIKSFPKNLRKKLKHILNQGYQFYTTDTESQFNYFYHMMYVPYTQARFGKGAVVRTQDYMKKILQQGEILLLFRNDHLLLGSLNKYEHDRFLSICAAATENIPPAMFKGASEAMDYFSILTAFEKGCRVVDFLGSRPLLDDGAFRYKRKWGTYIDNFYRPMDDIYFKTVCLNTGVKSYLANNPFIIKTSKGFRGRVLLNTPTGDKDLNSCAKRYQTKGLTGIDIFCTAGIQNNANKYLDNNVPEIKVHDISNSPHPANDFCLF